jgi:hypothetical protein
VCSPGGWRVACAASRGLGGYATDWELLILKNHAEALGRTTFHLNGQVGPNPFQ